MDLTFHIYNPVGWKKSLGYSVNFSQCRYQVFSDMVEHQCNRSPKILIDEYGFCKQHANMIIRDYGEEIDVQEWPEKE